MNKIALGMIVKWDELKLLKKCLNSVEEHIDGGFISVNYPPGVPYANVDAEVKKFADKHDKLTFDVSPWTNFGEARNRNMDLVAKSDFDFYLWLDADDLVQNASKLHHVAAATPNHINSIYMPYDYEHDDFGNVIVQHYVARMVRNDGTYAWSNKILHESLEPIRHCGKAMNNEIHIVHSADSHHRSQSLIRNIEMLEKELQGEGGRPDARTLYYLGTAFIDVGRNDDAKDLLTQYLQMSGWAEERAQAWVSIGRIYGDEGNSEEARKCFIHGLAENPKDPNPCVELAKLDMQEELWAKAIEWLTMALQKKSSPMATTVFSTDTIYRAHMYLADCFMAQGGKDIDKALKHALKALEMRPDEATRSYYEGIEAIIKHRKMAEGTVLVLKELENEKVSDKVIQDFIANLPFNLRDNPAILRYQKRHTPPKVWDKKSIVIFTGNSVVGEWGPWSLEEGVGGSEEAVVRLGRELTDLGWQVWVYGNPGIRAGEYEGVQWRNYWELNLADNFDVFVGWRMPWFFDIKMNSRKKYLWLHDVMEKEEFTKERLDNLDKVIVLSEYHRKLYPMIPDDKIFLSTNGITPEDFEKEDNKHERHPHKVIYMSSHSRGLQTLYEIWPEVKKAVPDATLDVYYGWNSYDSVNRGNPERMAWKQQMQNWVKELDDVTDNGKISQYKIVKEIFKSGVWAYPCPFPEISCITAMKAQAGGANPVSSDFAALNETVQFGTKVHMEPLDKNTPVGEWNKAQVKEYTRALIDALQNPITDEERKKMMDWSRKNQSWSAVAGRWVDEFQS